MWPWLNVFAPQLYWPFSGDVKQNIEPNTHWFFSGIMPQSGDAEIEEQAFGISSYGTQLGLMSKIILDLCEQLPPNNAAAQKALQELQWVHEGISRIKENQRKHK